jgi:hypothetical protein
MILQSAKMILQAYSLFKIVLLIHHFFKMINYKIFKTVTNKTVKAKLNAISTLTYQYYPIIAFKL